MSPESGLTLEFVASGRPARVAAYDSAAGKVIAEAAVAPGADIIVGSDSACTLLLPGQFGLDKHVLIKRGRHLLLKAGMSVLACGDAGEDRLRFTYDELRRRGQADDGPALRWTRMNISICPGVSVWVEYLPTGQRLPAATGG